jgi:hypothetical protein
VPKSNRKNGAGPFRRTIMKNKRLIDLLNRVLVQGFFTFRSGLQRAGTNGRSLRFKIIFSHNHIATALHYQQSTMTNHEILF